MAKTKKRTKGQKMIYKPLQRKQDRATPTRK